MKNSFFQSKNHQLILKLVEGIPNQRTQAIVSCRFGLEDGHRQTLEAIGQKYNITRERVRQIENAAFVSLYDNGAEKKLSSTWQKIDNFFNQQGNLVREERLMKELTNTDQPHPYRGSLFLTLALGRPYNRFVESQAFYPLWTNSEEVLTKAERIINDLTGKLNKDNQTIEINTALGFLKEKHSQYPETYLMSYLDATKEVHQNGFGKVGLAHWSEINPRGVKDKAYIVFKQQSKPLHFREVADLINQAGFNNSTACPQTVHNELIKDGRFVLVGRGIYALTEWGYKPGTIREVIADLLKKTGPMKKDQILQGVLKDRLVKENTVLINLQNRQYFAKDNNGRYYLSDK